MNQARTQSIVMDGYGSYLGMEKSCFVLKDRSGNEEKYPLRICINLVFSSESVCQVE